MKQLRACYQSLIAALTPQAEIRIIVNGHDPETESWLRATSHAQLQWEAIDREPRTVARNRAFEVGQSRVICFLDDDVTVPIDFFIRCEHLFLQHSEVDVLGGPNLTPEDNTWAQKLFGGVLTSWFAAPIVRRRYLAHGDLLRTADERELSLCNLALRRTSFERLPLRFVAEMRSNEENLFLHECKLRGLTVASSPMLAVYHHRRQTLSAFLQQIASYGFGRAQQLLKAPESFHSAFGVPAFCWLLLLVSFFSPWGPVLLAVLIAIHLSLGFWAAVTSPALARLGPVAVLAAAPLTLLLHAAYGFGFWRGLAVQAFGWSRRAGEAYANAFVSYLQVGWRHLTGARER